LIAHYLNIEIFILKNPERKNSLHRAMAIYTIRSLTQLSYPKIAKYVVDIQASGVRSSVNRIKKLINNDSNVNDIYSFLIQKFSGNA
jgi:chromosomal replication initiation ATPase DnaA